jgi:hypothetical protein
VEVAKGFMNAYGTFDANRAIGYLAPEANVDLLVRSIGQVQDGPGLRLAIDWLRAVGYEQLLHSCREGVTSASGTGVRCSFDLHLLRSSEIDKGPYGPAEIDFTISEGKIVYASAMNFDYSARFSSEVWEPFTHWMYANHPKNAEVMYAVKFTDAALGGEPNRLWERYTKAWVDEVNA